MTKRQDILNGIHNIINEGLAPSQQKLSVDIHLNKYINGMLSESQSDPDIIKFLEPFHKAMNEGVRAELLARPLLEGMKKYSSVIPGIAKLAESLSQEINENASMISLIDYFEAMPEQLKSMSEGLLVEYAQTGSLNARADINNLLEGYATVDKSVSNLLAYINEGLYNTVANPNVINIYENASEGEVINVHGQKYIQDAEGNIRPLDIISEQKIMERVNDFINETIDKAKEDAELDESNKDHYYNIDNEIKLLSTIDSLMESKFASDALKNTLTDYRNALASGYPEEMLYESFMQRMNNEFSFIDDVDVAINEMEERTAPHRENISLTKILEQMSADANYSHWVPLIEDAVVAYEKNPNPINRNILLNQCRMYESCPYIINIVSIVNSNNTAEGILMKESQDFIRQDAYVDPVYSPVQYIKENECIINVENQFYVKKGQHISKLNRDSIKNLSESFLALAKLVNDPRVYINEAENTIEFTTNDNSVVVITDKYVKIGENYETPEDLKNLSEMHMKYSNYDDISYLTASFLCENFNNIAKIDFVQTVGLNESDAKTLDLFKIKNNIFVAAHDNINEEHTFYRNVKPIQLKNIINNHFGIQVSNLFEDLMPNQDKIEKELNEIKHEYEEKIDKLYDMKDQLEESLENSTMEDEYNRINEAITSIDREINEAKKDYKKFQKKAKEVIEGDKKDKQKTDKNGNVLNDDEEEIDPIDDETGAFEELPDNPAAEAPSDDDFDMNAEPTEDDPFGDIDAEFGDDSFDDFEGSDSFDDFDGSDFDGSDDYISSDGDDLTTELGTADDFAEDPFADNTAAVSDDDNSLIGSQNDDYNLDNEFDTDDELDDTDELGIDSLDDDDPFGDDTAELADADAEDDTATEIGDEGETEEVADDADLDYSNFKIVKVDFDVNVRTGERKNSGKVTVVVPWIDEEGNKTSETKAIDFYVTDIQGEKSAVLNTAGMSVEMYKAVLDAIKNSSAFQETESGDVPETADDDELADHTGDVDPVDTPDDTTPANPTEDSDSFKADAVSIDAEDDDATADDVAAELGGVSDDTIDELPTMDDADTPDVTAAGDDFSDEPATDDDDITADDANDIEAFLSGEADPFDSGSDETTVLTIDDGIEPQGIDVTATYKSGDTVIDTPANNIGMDGHETEPDEIPEAQQILSINGKKMHESVINLFDEDGLNERLVDMVADQVEADNDATLAGENIPAVSTEQDDVIGLISDVVSSYNEEGGDADSEINDYDVDGTNVSSINVTLGDNVYTFFTMDDGNVYSCLNDDFEENSQDIDTLQDFVNSDNENLSSASAEDAESVVELITDTIATETGDSFDYEMSEPESDDDTISEPVDEAQAVVRLKKKININGNRNAKLHIKNDDANQTTWKANTNNDDSLAANERRNGTPQENKNAKIIKNKAKKAGVPVNPPAQGGAPGGMM